VEHRVSLPPEQRRKAAQRAVDRSEAAGGTTGGDGGVAHGVKNVLLRTLIHQRAPETIRGRAFAAYNGARNGVELGALALGGLAVSAIGTRSALLLAGLGAAAIGAVCLLLLIKRRHTVAAVNTNEARVVHAHIQG
jgi:hypothetical protein